MTEPSTPNPLAPVSASGTAHPEQLRSDVAEVSALPGVYRCVDANDEML